MRANKSVTRDCDGKLRLPGVIAMTVNRQASTRELEESRIVARWFSRLEECFLTSDKNEFLVGLYSAGLSERDLTSGQCLLKHRHLDIALSRIRQTTPDITLRLFAKAEILDLGLVGYAAINSDTVGDALKAMNQYHSLSSDRYTDELAIDDDFVRITPIPLPMHADDYQNICEDSLSGNWKALQLLLGPNADPRKIHVNLAYRQPSYEKTYFEIFGPNCYFNETLTALAFPTSWLKLKVHRGSGALSDAYQAMCERILGPPTERRDTPLEVRRLLLSRSGKEIPSLEQAATMLRLTTTQLRKRLYRAGTTYKALVLETRMELAKHYLIDTELSVQEIAYLLDYATPAPFSRAFKRVFGIAPAGYRQQNL